MSHLHFLKQRGWTWVNPRIEQEIERKVMNALITKLNNQDSQYSKSTKANEIVHNDHQKGLLQLGHKSGTPKIEEHLRDEDVAEIRKLNPHLNV